MTGVLIVIAAMMSILILLITYSTKNLKSTDISFVVGAVTMVVAAKAKILDALTVVCSLGPCRSPMTTKLGLIFTKLKEITT